ncbi:MAG: hypothetical protein GY839_18830 [candidate division Zixibacteria bacterium]|nr:hypothetical protein [candidate division Zixibacteria bacterium]
MAVLNRRLKAAESKVTTPNDLEERFINEWIEWYTTGDASLMVTPRPPRKSLIYYYHVVKKRMKQQGLEMHPDLREKLDREIQESLSGESKAVNHAG